MTDFGYAWTVYQRREDLPSVAQGYSTKVSVAQTLVELVLLYEDLAERGELTGPGGKAWVCRLGDPEGEEGPVYAKGHPCWEPEKPR